MDDIKTISVFNEEYINNYLFLKDDLLKGTFDIFIKSPKYDKNLETIESLLLGVRETFHVENDYLFQLNPCEYDTVPYFVIVECNRAMLGTDEVEMEE